MLSKLSKTRLMSARIIASQNSMIQYPTANFGK
jgi:hypothetical protein